MDLRRTTLEDNAAALCGQTLARVSYCEIDDEGHQPDWARYGSRFDALDFGLELETTRGEVFHMIWDDKFCQYGITLDKEVIREKVINCSIWDVTKNSRWYSVINTPIEAITIYRSWIDTDHIQVLCPTAFEIIFESGQHVFVAAARYFSDRDVLAPLTDEVAVLFEYEQAKRYRIGPFGIVDNQINISGTKYPEEG